MLVVMEAGASPEQIEAVVRHIEKLGLKAHPIPGAHRTAIGVTGKQGATDPATVENFPGVKEVIAVTQAYKLVSREAKPDDTIVNVGGVDVGGNGVIVVGDVAGYISHEKKVNELVISHAASGNGCLIPVLHLLQLFDDGRFHARLLADFAEGCGFGSLSGIHQALRELPPRRLANGDERHAHTVICVRATDHTPSRHLRFGTNTCDGFSHSDG